MTRSPSHFPASARNITVLFLMGRDAIGDMTKGLAWMPLWGEEGCSVTLKRDFIQYSLSSPAISINYMEGNWC